MFYQLYLIWAWANLKHPSIFSRWTIARTTGPISNRLNNALKINIPKIPVGPTQLDLRIVMGQIHQKMYFWVLPPNNKPNKLVELKTFFKYRKKLGENKEKPSSTWVRPKAQKPKNKFGTWPITTFGMHHNHNKLPGQDKQSFWL